MEAFQAFLGFILGVIIFLLILYNLKIIFMGYPVMIFFFMISLAIGMILAKIFSWLVVILIVIGIVLFILSKFLLNDSPPSDKEGEEATTENETPKANEQETNTTEE